MKTFAGQMLRRAHRFAAFMSAGFILVMVFAPTDVTWISKSWSVLGAFLLVGWSIKETFAAPANTIPTSALPLGRVRGIFRSKHNGYTLQIHHDANVVDTEIREFH